MTSQSQHLVRGIGSNSLADGFPGQGPNDTEMLAINDQSNVASKDGRSPSNQSTIQQGALNGHRACIACNCQASGPQDGHWTDHLKEKHSCCQPCTQHLQNSKDNFFEGLFGAIIIFAIFGGSITFQCIIAISENGPSHGRISYKRARTFLAISWFLFTLDLFLSSMFTAVAYLRRRRTPSKEWEVSGFQYANLAATLILSELAVIALVFAGIAISAYSETVGYTAAGLFLFLFLAILVAWGVLCSEVFPDLKAKREANKAEKEGGAAQQV